MASSSPLCSFGVITDIQYANVDNGTDFAKRMERYYRNSENLLRNAVTSWNKSDQEVSFMVQLGDLIDGLCIRNAHRDYALHTVLDVLRMSPSPTYHVLGNHDLYNFTRSEYLDSELNSAALPNVSTPDPQQTAYYHFTPVQGWHIIVLDSYDCGLLGHPLDSEKYIAAEKYCRSKNPNKHLNDPDGMYGRDRRFRKFNGCVGAEQIQWLEEVLQQAEENREKAIIMAHVPVLEEAARASCLCWDCDEVLSVIHRHSCVHAFFAGHHHPGGYARDANGIHHVTLPGIIETHPNNNAFGTVHLYPDRLELEGVGNVPSLILNGASH